MPLISYLCSCGESTKRYVKAVKDATSFTLCLKCGLEAKRTLGNTSSSHKITIDNGLMARSLEIDPNIQEINDERSNNDYTEES
jgi:hypothetical protein